MSFFSDLLTDFAIYSFTSTKSKWALVVGGVIAVLVFGSLLYSIYSSEPVTIQDLIVRTVD